jgi:hypothetical protein
MGDEQLGVVEGLLQREQPDVGSSRHVFAQIVDENTGLVLGGIVTPIPVTLDGQTHTVTVPMEATAYTAPANAKLTVQVVASATPYLNLGSVGRINISHMEIVLPTVGPGANVTPEYPPAAASASADEPLLLVCASGG